MTRKTLVCLATAVTAATVQLAGCGQHPNQPNAPASTVTAPSAQLQVDQSAEEFRQLHRAMAAALNLTDAQRAQLRAIKQRHRDPEAKQALKAQLRMLGRMISAETVDPAGITEAINDMVTAFRARVPRKVAKATEIREVLTPEQRQRVGTLLNENADAIKNAMDRMRDQGIAAISANMNLTPEQSAALQELKEQDEISDERKFDTMRAAITTFMTDGNQAALRSSIESVLTTENVQPTVEWIATLNRVQRQQLVANMRSYMHQLRRLHRDMEADMGMGGGADDGADGPMDGAPGGSAGDGLSDATSSTPAGTTGSN